MVKLNVVLFVCLVSVVLVLTYNWNITSNSYLVLVQREQYILNNHHQEPTSLPSSSSGLPSNASSGSTSPSTNPTVSITRVITSLQHLSDLNETHVWGVPMESVHANYTRNIYFSVKSTYRYYSKRLLDLMLTWFQVVDKHKV